VIPPFNQSGVLPPFLSGSEPTDVSAVAPYKTSLVSFVSRFSTSDERKKILHGLLKYRVSLKQLGITKGFQWIDGSFIEDVEKNRGRAPNDIDLVTFAHRPNEHEDKGKWSSLVNTRTDLFYPKESKNQYLCDAYFVDFSLPADILVNRTSYWFGLFSHQSDSFLWKGMLQIDLSENEDDAFHVLGTGGSNAS
jgi:hypothetical protein